ncbi:GNAT family N-acetyltransferase [Microlunatus soli]|uniref:Ribosomal protein S18 acetylase RimI n=1 Tax=Microlunatus soli TaxID=630515 RepID=A0A1H1YSM0_9ACTN|nr:GNAT family N-acetyltransferase [Microlunatus soli]SDT24434.1 Ribosomal protein S18 acetylase RimI [Microlunatus soli]
MTSGLFQRVSPGDADAIAQLAELINAAGAVDDPDSPPIPADLLGRQLEFGWDLEPSERFLYRPSADAAVVGTLSVHAPQRDNLQLMDIGVTTHPDHRRAGHGTAMMSEAIRRAQEIGRTILWAGCAHDDEGAAAFLTANGFGYASHEARRYQWPDRVDHDQLDELYRTAEQAASDYELIRTTAPSDDELLTELIEVTAAINDAPMGELDFEDEKFDLQRLKDFEAAALGKGEKLYRTFARHRDTGKVGGHTIMMVQPSLPTYGNQYDTAVHRDHRGHRLGMLLKIDMMRWLAKAEPQIERIETWNHADNDYMISVNEKIGYRLNRIYDTYQRKL